MVDHANDRARHDRLLELTGGDAVALSEIGAAEDAIAAQDHPDLCAMVRLAVHRDRLADRNREIPLGLPAIWASPGNIDRAASITNSLPDPTKRVTALASVATATAASGDHERAAGLLDDAEQIAGTIAEVDPGLRAYALARVAGAAADTGDHDRAERVALAIADHPDSHASVLARMAGTAARAGDLDRAERIIGTHPHRVHGVDADGRGIRRSG